MTMLPWPCTHDRASMRTWACHLDFTGAGLTSCPSTLHTYNACNRNITSHTQFMTLHTSRFTGVGLTPTASRAASRDVRLLYVCHACSHAHAHMHMPTCGHAPAHVGMHLWARGLGHGHADMGTHASRLCTYYLCMPMHAYQCIPVHTDAYRCMPIHAHVCPRMPMHAYACLCMPMHAPCMPMHAHACPMHAYACLCLRMPMPMHANVRRRTRVHRGQLALRPVS